jgi:hypothetical protein
MIKVNSEAVNKGNSLHIWTVAANMSNKQLRTANKMWSPVKGLGGGLTNHHHKNLPCYEMIQRALGLENKWFGI